MGSFIPARQLYLHHRNTERQSWPEKLMEQLSQRLSKEDYELVQELWAQTAIAQCEESESHFKYGFSAGLMFSRKPMNKCSRRKKNR